MDVESALASNIPTKKRVKYLHVTCQQPTTDKHVRDLLYPLFHANKKLKANIYWAISSVEAVQMIAIEAQLGPFLK